MIPDGRMTRSPDRVLRSPAAASTGSVSDSTAMREVQAAFVYRWQPLTLCAYEVHDAVVADLRNQQIMLYLGFAVVAPACDWRLDVDDGREPESWRLADRLRTEGLDGILVPSYAVGASPQDLNLVLWSWNQAAGAQVSVIDDHGRLPPPPGR